MRARTLHEHMVRIAPWVDWEGSTCDGFKAGDPNAEVRGIAVGWQSSLDALRQAAAAGCNLFVTHEPTFYSHLDDDPTLGESAPARAKRTWLAEHNMVVYRCHDAWDVFPELGIVDAWSAFLELGEPIAQARFYNLHALTPVPAWELVGRISQQVRSLGQQMVQFIGRKWQPVSRLAVGTGAITDVRRMVELGADAVLATDDGVSLWRDGAWMSDLGLPLLLVNHTTAEIPGLRRLAEYLKQQFAQVPVTFVGATCGYEIKASEQSREPLIHMRRDRLDDLPVLRLPEGYALRPMAADEEWAYLQVMRRSHGAGLADEAWFRRTFSDDPAYDPSYLKLIWRGDRPVAAAAAWHNEIDGEPWGMVHWVGVVDDERGRGLGRAITLAALHGLRERGYARAMLGTQGWRLPAIATYLSLGLEPWPNTAETEEEWRRALADLERWRRQAAASL